jgi:hypothetical protein
MRSPPLQHAHLGPVEPGAEARVKLGEARPAPEFDRVAGEAVEGAGALDHVDHRSFSLARPPPDPVEDLIGGRVEGPDQSDQRPEARLAPRPLDAADVVAVDPGTVGQLLRGDARVPAEPPDVFGEALGVVAHRPASRPPSVK